MKDWITAGIVVYVAYVSDANSDFRCIHMSLNFFGILCFFLRSVYIMIYEVILDTTRIHYLRF